MAVPRSSLPIILGGTLLFGALLFLLGLLVGIGLSSPGPASSQAGNGAPVAVSPVPPAPAPGGASGGAAPVPAAPAPAAAVPPPASPPAKSGDATPETAPAIKPLKVKGFGYGAPPSSPPASTLRGRLLEQTGMTSAMAPNSDPATQSAATQSAATQSVAAATPAPAPTPKESPAEPLIFSVAVGRFLLADNAARRLAEAQAKGFQPVVVVADPPDSSGWLTVTLGPRGDAITAGRLAEDATAQGFDTLLVSWLAP